MGSVFSAVEEQPKAPGVEVYVQGYSEAGKTILIDEICHKESTDYVHNENKKTYKHAIEVDGLNVNVDLILMPDIEEDAEATSMKNPKASIAVFDLKNEVSFAYIQTLFDQERLSIPFLLIIGNKKGKEERAVKKEEIDSLIKSLEENKKVKKVSYIEISVLEDKELLLKSFGEWFNQFYKYLEEEKKKEDENKEEKKEDENNEEEKKDENNEEEKKEDENNEEKKEDENNEEEKKEDENKEEEKKED